MGNSQLEVVGTRQEEEDIQLGVDSSQLGVDNSQLGVGGIQEGSRREVAQSKGEGHPLQNLLAV